MPSTERRGLDDGAGHFSHSGVSQGGPYSTGVESGDLDGAGDLDVFVTHGALWGNTGKGDPNEVWFNEAP
jgi:hypothetical protein